MLMAGRLGSAAEGVGVARGAMDMTVTYLKQRKQFGTLIGEFQALHHRASHLYSEVEIARALVIKAQQLLATASDNNDLQQPEKHRVRKERFRTLETRWSS